MREIHFIRDYDFRPIDDPYMTVAYKAGMTVEVCEECETRAIAAGAASYPDFLEDDLFDVDEEEALGGDE